MLDARCASKRACSLRLAAGHLFSNRRGLLTLAIETSCDDTSVAVLEKSEFPNVTNGWKDSQGALATLHFHRTLTADNAAHKGIHPIKALESHRQNLATLVNESLAALPTIVNRNIRSTNVILPDGEQKRKPDFISVTRGPGMRSNLSCGLDTAKGLAVAWQVPLLAVHHMQAHALTPRLAWALKAGTLTEKQVSPQPQFPFFSLLVSGGHTMLLHSTGLTEHSVLVSTADTAIGEALDKVGRLLLPRERLTRIRDTAFAKHLSEYAFADSSQYGSYKIARERRDEIQKPPNKFGWAIQSPFANTTALAYSFSGIASRMQSLFEERQAAVEGGISDEERILFARTALGTSFEHLASRSIMAIQSLEKSREVGNGKDLRRAQALVISGGVAANPFLRHVLQEMLQARLPWNIEVISPPLALCTDNAAMIGWCGIEMYEAGWRSALGCEPLRKWSMDQESAGTNGIIGIPGWMKVRDRAGIETIVKSRHIY